MATPSVVDVFSGVVNGDNENIVADTSTGDLFVLVQGTDDDGSDNFLIPTSGAGTGSWELIASHEQSGNSGIQAYYCPVTSGGSKTVVASYDGSGDNLYCLFVLRNLHGTPLDGSSTAAGDNVATLAIPSISPVGSDDLLIAAWAARDVNDITVPGTLIERANVQGDAGCFAVGSQVLSASGATGTRAAAMNPDESMSGLMFAIRGGTSVSVNTTQFFFAG